MSEEGRIYFIMGVSGAGKTTIGQLLADRLDLPFHDGDDYHPEANLKKMEEGFPLNDADRADWLQALNLLARNLVRKKGGVIACSALKRSYRQLLGQELEGQVVWVFLHGDYSTIDTRLRSREGHFMPPDLLQSQFDTLEEPANAIRLHISHPPETLVEQLLGKLRSQGSEAGILGLGVMGKSLALNLAEKGFSLSLYNRRVPGREEEVATRLIAEHELSDRTQGFEDLRPFVHSLSSPRKILLMVPAGPVVDHLIGQLTPLLEPGDILMDGGNAHYKDTERRQKELAEKGLRWLGLGISGGVAGARRGPSLMPGGDREAYPAVKPLLEALAARDQSGRPCCAWLGHGGAGHFVKMVHNGIEYAEMQLLAEFYDLLRHGSDWSPEAIAVLFESWKERGQGSYLLEITVDILRFREENTLLLDQILDQAGNKGTGGWTSQAAAELGIPTPNLTAALFARYQSAFPDLRRSLAELHPAKRRTEGSNISEQQLLATYSLVRSVNHQQGFHLLRAAATAYRWPLDLQEVARIWTNGCIIRSKLMEEIAAAGVPEGGWLTAATEKRRVAESMEGLRSILEAGNRAAIPLPCCSATLQYLLTFTAPRLPANLIQAQRDYFGAHSYRKKDDPSGKSYHSDWTKPGDLDRP